MMDKTTNINKSNTSRDLKVIMILPIIIKSLTKENLNFRDNNLMEKKAIISKERVNKTSKSLIPRKETSEKVSVDNWGYASIRDDYIY